MFILSFDLSPLWLESVDLPLTKFCFLQDSFLKKSSWSVLKKMCPIPPSPNYQQFYSLSQQLIQSLTFLKYWVSLLPNKWVDYFPCLCNHVVFLTYIFLSLSLLYHLLSYHNQTLGASLCLLLLFGYLLSWPSACCLSCFSLSTLQEPSSLNIRGISLKHLFMSFRAYYH